MRHQKTIDDITGKKAVQAQDELWKALILFPYLPRKIKKFLETLDERIRKAFKYYRFTKKEIHYWFNNHISFGGYDTIFIVNSKDIHAYLTILPPESINQYSIDQNKQIDFYTESIVPEIKENFSKLTEIIFSDKNIKDIALNRSFQKARAKINKIT